MGMPVRIVLFAPDDSLARSAARAAFDRIATLEVAMSDYSVQGELRGLERRAGEWVQVSAELFDVTRHALALARTTEGAFDPTVGPVVALWREARRTLRLPSPRSLDSARALTGFAKVDIDSVQRRVRLSLPGMRLDLGGVAKGYIIQDAMRVLRERGVASVLIEAGGDVVVGEPPPGSEGWDIDTPLLGNSAADSLFALRASRLRNAALSTSGPASQFAEIDAVRYSHVVDPRTGQALTTSVRAHVIADDAALADALATALTVLGYGSEAVLGPLFPGVIAITAR